MIVTFDKKTGEIISTEESRITSVFDSPEWRANLDEKGLGWIGWPYELGTEALNYKVAVNEKGEGQAIIPKNEEEGEA